MPAIIKNELRVLNSDSFAHTILNNPTYFFLSGITPWTNELNPPTPIDNTVWENRILSDVFGVKRIQQTDIRSVLPRTNWIEGTVYDQYDHNVDMVNARNPDTGDFYRYYVITEEFNIYICLSNNYRAPSIYMPAGTVPGPFRTPDGYLWKYMYTVRANDAFKFMTESWMPCYTLTYNDGSSQWNSQESAVPGTIDNISVINKGTGYRAGHPPVITITGDGTGAAATPVVNPSTGELDDIIVTDYGSGYTTATVTVSDPGGTGSGATAKATIGPRLGHGYDPRVELGATYLMIKTSIQGDENGILPTDVEFRSSGIIYLPGTDPTDSLAIKMVDDTANLFNKGEVVTGSDSGTTADIVHVDYIAGIIYVNNIQGVFSQDESISSNAGNASAIQTISSGFLPLDVLVGDDNTMVSGTGRILYMANREKITRQPDQREDIIAVLSF